MKVALISVENNIIRRERPDYEFFTNLKEFKRRKALWTCPNLSLLTVAGLLPLDWEYIYKDLNFDVLDDEEYDMALISVTTAQAPRAYEIADYYRRRGIKVVMGGIHTTVMPEEALQHADAVCIGEFENVADTFITDVKLGKIRSLYNGKKYVSLDKSCIPRYDLAEKYPYHVVPLQITRGCPHQCEFCASSAVYGKIRRQKPLNLIDENIQAILSHWTFPYLFFTDDNLFIDDSFTKELMTILLKHRLQWYAFSDVRIAQKKDLLKLMHNAGCRQLLIGFESLSEASLRKVNQSQWKRKQIRDYHDAVNAIQEQGIGVVGSFMLGLDDEGDDAFVRIPEFVENTNMYATNITVLTPFPGTRVYSRFLQEKRIFTTDWKRYNGFELTFYPQNHSIEWFNAQYKELNQRLDSTKRIENMLYYFKNILKGNA